MSVSSHTEQNSMSAIIRAAARQTVEQTQEALRLAEGKDPGEDYVTIMVNGEKRQLSRSDYQLLKQKAKGIQQQMKEQLQALKHTRFHADS